MLITLKNVKLPGIAFVFYFLNKLFRTINGYDKKFSMVLKDKRLEEEHVHTRNGFSLDLWYRNVTKRKGPLSGSRFIKTVDD